MKTFPLAKCCEDELGYWTWKTGKTAKLDDAVTHHEQCEVDGWQENVMATEHSGSIHRSYPYNAREEHTRIYSSENTLAISKTRRLI
jgi:hypothetical protein